MKKSTRAMEKPESMTKGDKVIHITSMRGSVRRVVEADVVYLNGRKIKDRFGSTKNGLSGHPVRSR